MNLKEIRELIDYLIEKDISEFELERGDVRVRIRRGNEVQVLQAAPQPTVLSSVSAAAAESASASTTPASSPKVKDIKEEEGLHMLRSPIVGTYYEAPAPGAPPYVKSGDRVQAGQVVAIIEAMKLMNEIEVDVTGEIVKIFANNGQPVEYGQPLFSIRPS